MKTLSRTMRARTLACVSLALLAGAAPAAASPLQESILQDDPAVLNPRSNAELEPVFQMLSNLGVDRLRVSLFWDHVAPAIKSQTKPNFPAPGPAWPASYPQGSWAAYDRIVLMAQKYGIGILFSVTSPGPAWATPGRGQPEGVIRPDPAEFRDFVTAAGLRYSGQWPADDQPPPPPRPGLFEPEPPPNPVVRLPRVDHWSIWNEPNYPQWLRPIWRQNRPKTVEDMVAAAPHHYRRLVDAAYTGLLRSGHEPDTILIGETAPRGGKNPRMLGNSMPPGEFVRELYCLRSDFRPYTGRDARVRRCPATRRARGRFRAQHPGLFEADGWAHHPYSLSVRRWRKPTWRHPLADNIPLANLGRLTSTLDRAAFRYGSSKRMGIWITEYGYQTTPPDPLVGVRPARQGPLTSWGEFLAYRNPRVASIAQFLLRDDKPVPGFENRPLDRRRWISWQSGLFDLDGRRKPFYDDYQRPIHVRQRGRLVRIFAGYRPAPTGWWFPAVIEHASAGGSWRVLRSLTVKNKRGYINAAVRTPGPGFVRVRFNDPKTGQVVGTRPTPID